MAMAAVLFPAHGELQIQPRAEVQPRKLLFNDEPRTVVLNAGDWAALPGLSGGTLVRMENALGNIHIELLDQDAPGTVENFLFYADEQRYSLSFIHRSVPDFVIQGGGFRLVTTQQGDTQIGTVETEDPIPNEFKPENSNVRGTLSMARLGGDPDSATSQFFINLDDNDFLDSEQDSVENDGFTVFARVVGRGMEVADAIADLPIVSLGGALSELPVRNFEEDQQGLQINNLVLFSRIARVDTLPVANRPGLLGFEVVSVADPELLEASVQESRLILGIPGGASGETHITLRLFESGFPDSEGVEVTVPIHLGTGLVPSGRPAEGWKTSRWLGLYFDQGDGWIYHPDLEWLFIGPEVIQDGIFIYTPVGWVWSNEKLWPYLWHYKGNNGAGTWIYWARGTREPAWFFDFSLNDGAGAWMTFEE